MRSAKPPRYLKSVRARGKVYGYFDTGQKDAGGKRIYTSIGRLDDPAFGAKYAAMLGRRTARERVTSQITVPSLIDMFQRSDQYKKLAANSKRAYDLYLRVFAERLPTAPAQLVERRDIILLLDSMGERPAAANLLLGTVSSLYFWGRDRGHVTNEPCKDISKFDMGEHDPWPDHIVDAALASDNAIVKLAVSLLYYTAQRISDVCEMQWSDIRKDRISVRQQKTDKPLDIPLHANLRATLEVTPKSGLLILARPDGTALGAARVRFILKGWTRKQGAEVAAHGLRKNAVNTLLEVGCSVAETAAISGQSLQMIEHYAKKRAQGKLASAAILKWERNG